MQILLEVISPVFLVIAVGYSATRVGMMPVNACDALMKYAQQLAIPCLLFLAIWKMDLAMDVNWRLLASFYLGSLACFIIGLLGARHLFRRCWEDAVVIGFTALFGNTVLLGLAVVDRAYGGQSLDATFTIVAFHALFCYSIGVVAYELLRDRSTASGAIIRQVTASLMTNALLVGLVVGLVFNLLQVRLPEFALDAVNLVASSGIPVALFALGGVLTRYRIEGDIGVITMVCLVSLVLHPAMTYLLAAGVFRLPDELVRSGVVTSAMAPGINAFLFASIYQRAMRIAASSVLIGTLASMLTASLWISIVT